MSLKLGHSSCVQHIAASEKGKYGKNVLLMEEHLFLALHLLTVDLLVATAKQRTLFEQQRLFNRLRI